MCPCSELHGKASETFLKGTAHQEEPDVRLAAMHSPRVLVRLDALAGYLTGELPSERAQQLAVYCLCRLFPLSRSLQVLNDRAYLVEDRGERQKPQSAANG